MNHPGATGKARSTAQVCGHGSPICCRPNWSARDSTLASGLANGPNARVRLMRGVTSISRASNNELERTRSAQQTDCRGPRRSIQCWTDRGTDRSASVPPPSAVADAPAARTVGNVPAWAVLVRSLHRPRPALGACPGIFRHPVGPVSTRSLPSASSWLGTNDQTTNSGFPVVTPRQGTVRPSNKGLERTRPAANGVTGPCRSTQCCAGTGTAD